MTELAYMVREDWAGHGAAMAPQSAVIRDWIGEAPYLFAVRDPKLFSSDRGADLEAAEFIAPNGSTRRVFGIRDLEGLARRDRDLGHAIVVLHPFDEHDLQALADAVERQSVDRVFVLVWGPRDIVRVWLDGRGATDLQTGKAADAPHPLLIAAAEAMIDEEYNGLRSGRGKDAVVQLVRSFADEGYPVEAEPWLRAYFAAGGTFTNAASIAKLIGEMKKGTRHRVQTRYVDNIVELLRERIAKD